MLDILGFYLDGDSLVSCAVLPAGSPLLMASGETFYGHIVGVVDVTAGRCAVAAVLYLPERVLDDKAKQTSGRALFSVLGLSEVSHA